MTIEIKPGKGFMNNWTIEEVRSFFNLNPNLSDQKVEELIPVLNSDDLILRREDNVTAKR